MKLIKCTACSEQISKKAPACPKCGEPNKKAKHVSGSGFFTVLLIVIVGTWFFNIDTDGIAVSQKSLYDGVASDAVTQYEMAKRQGDPVQICVQAGIVSAAYLQAKDESNYNIAKANEKIVCKKAGL